MVSRLGALIGWPAGQFGGITTSGGSIANLTALLAARNIRYGKQWEKGWAPYSGKLPAVLASADSHYSVSRAAGILGLGTDQVLRIPVDSKRRMDVGKLVETLDRGSSTHDVFCLVASSCSTSTGSFDPLEELSAVARERNLWLHVDGAHGASVLFSRRHRNLVRGIEAADSVIWDAHKMLHVPSLSTFVLYQNKKHAFEAFHQEAPYLFDKSGEEVEQYNGGLRTLECTRPSLALPLWGIWSVYGPTLFEDIVDVTFALAQEFYDLLNTSGDFLPLHEPQANILCFRHVPKALQGAPSERISAFQQSLAQRLVRGGEYYITSTKLDGVSALRVTLINPLTGTQELEGLLGKLREIGKTLFQT